LAFCTPERIIAPWLSAQRGEIEGELEIEMTPTNADEPYEWVWVDATYLRDLAQRCSRLARDCPHLATSHQLEAIGVELMQKAAELDELQHSSRQDWLRDNRHSPTPARKK